MRGNVYDIRIDVENILLKLEEKQEYNLPLNIKEYNVNKEELEDILKDIEYSNLPEWSKLEYDIDNVILDETSSECILYMITLKYLIIEKIGIQ